MKEGEEEAEAAVHGLFGMEGIRESVTLQGEHALKLAEMVENW